MKVILAVDAIVPPLTGIGRYTWELARRYASRPNGLQEAQFYFAGRWMSDPAVLLDRSALPASRGSGAWVSRLPASWQRMEMRRRLRGRVFHSPNYFLPATVETGVVTVHDLSVFRYPETHPVERVKQFEKSFRSTLERAAHLITDSEYIRDEIGSYFGWSRERITAIGLGVPQEFGPRPHASLIPMLRRYGIEPDGYALCVSTLEPRKRVDQLLNAYALLPDVLRRRFPLVLAGSKGWLSDRLHAQIESCREAGWLHYLGFVPEETLPQLYAGARAFLYPSLYEGFGLPVLEALASGVPTLTSRSSSLPEVSGGAAWLVDPDDVAGLRSGIESVLCDDAWRDQATERGLRVADSYSWARCVSETIDVYQSVARRM